jgi:hypothetical protein
VQDFLLSLIKVSKTYDVVRIVNKPIASKTS